ncbi:MAG TPA: RidA family protein [Alphaproteobacteria bacterium]
MTGKIDARLKELGIAFKPAPPPAGNYVPVVTTGNLVFVAGQVPVEDGQRKFIGKLGKEYQTADGQKAARLCAISILNRLKDAYDLDRVVRCVKLVGFVNATPDFTEQPAVVNGASDLMVQVFGDAGKHARSAVGVASLPFGCAVEVEGIFEIK